jgi:hypothetical protein
MGLVSSSPPTHPNLFLASMCAASPHQLTTAPTPEGEAGQAGASHPSPLIFIMEGSKGATRHKQARLARSGVLQGSSFSSPYSSRGVRPRLHPNRHWSLLHLCEGGLEALHDTTSSDTLSAMVGSSLGNTSLVGPWRRWSQTVKGHSPPSLMASSDGGRQHHWEKRGGGGDTKGSWHQQLPLPPVEGGYAYPKDMHICI